MTPKFSAPSQLRPGIRFPFVRMFLSIAAVLAMVLGAVLSTAGTDASAAGTGTLWGSAAPSNLAPNSDRAGVEVGTRFTVQSAGTATGIQFWKTSHGGDVQTGTLWTSTGTRLATTTFVNESDSGWQTAEFANPVSLKPGATYVVSYFAPHGGYAATYHFEGQASSTALSVGANSGVFRYGSSSQFPEQTWHGSQYWVGLTFVPVGNRSAAPTPIAQPSSSSNPAPTASAEPRAGFPNATNTGVPAGVTLSKYTGPCTITTPNTVIDAKNIGCNLTVRAPNVAISRSVLNGTVYTNEDRSGSFTISDSQVNIGSQIGTGIGAGNFTATRVEVTGGNRSINCASNCIVEDSYVHGQFTDHTGVTHESGIRMGSGSVIRGNTIACDAPDVAPDAGCSAALTGYGDFATVQNDTIDGNFFAGGSGGYCTYGGSTSGKPFSSGVRGMVFTNNVFQRGESGKCGWFGPITSFDTGAPGNVWKNNTYDNGKIVAPAD